MRKKEYNKPTMTAVAVQPTSMLAASGGKGNGLTGNVNGTDNVIGGGGDDNEGRDGDAKDHIFSLWDEE